MTPGYSMTLQALFPGSNMPPGSASQQVTGISNDSRRIQGGDLFLACRGEHYDASQFIDAAVAQGAVAVACDDLMDLADPGVPVIAVANLARCQADLAARFYRQPSQALQMIGKIGREHV